MLLTSAQAGALADFAEADTEVMIATALFDPSLNPEKLVVFRSDGKKVVVHRDGTITPYNGELSRKRKTVDMQVVERLQLGAADDI